jgi:hypothetical protein
MPVGSIDEESVDDAEPAPIETARIAAQAFSPAPASLTTREIAAPRGIHLGGLVEQRPSSQPFPQTRRPGLRRLSGYP